MQTSAIRYRVVDFLRDHAPFHAMEEDDLLALVAGGRVRFHEIDELVYWQGKPPGPFFFVIQQGTVTLWEQEEEGERLRDVRGPGDLLGIDGLLGAVANRQSAKAGSDVVLYALPVADLQPLLVKYPPAARYLAAHAAVSVSYEGTERETTRATRVFVHEIVRGRPLVTASPSDSVREAARRMAAAGVSAAAVVGPDGTLLGLVTSAALLRLFGDGAFDAARPVESLMDRAPLLAAPESTVDACVLALADAGASVLVVTDGGAPRGRVHGVVAADDLAPVFGDHPLLFLRDAAGAAGLEALRAANLRARSFVLTQLTGPAAVDWLARLVTRFDARVAERLVGLAGAPPGRACWFFFGASGRGETLTALGPQLGLAYAEGEAAVWSAAYRRVFDSFTAAGFLPRRELSDVDLAFRCASLDEWKARYAGWVRDPLAARVYLGRPLFDLRPVTGAAALVAEMEALIRAEVVAHPEFLRLLAHDCLANLPPLSFFRDAVVEESGAQEDVFHLERRALRPLVDVGRVHGIAAGCVFSSSTVERLAAARARVPEDDAIFREAADTLRVLLYHQARWGLRRQDGGAEIPPSGLGGYDRQLLKSGFRSILRLLERAAEQRWETR